MRLQIVPGNKTGEWMLADTRTGERVENVTFGYRDSEGPASTVIVARVSHFDCAKQRYDPSPESMVKRIREASEPEQGRADLLVEFDRVRRRLLGMGRYIRLELAGENYVATVGCGCTAEKAWFSGCTVYAARFDDLLRAVIELANQKFPGEAEPDDGLNPGLLHCPFCLSGRTAIILGAIGYCVACSDCYARGSSCNAAEEAVAAWNKRSEAAR